MRPPRALTLLSTDDDGTSNTDNNTSIQMPHFIAAAASGDAGDTVTLFSDGVAVGTAVVAGDGSFSVAPTAALANGTHHMAYTFTDATGNVSALSGNTDVVIEHITQTASISSYTDAAGPITGTLTTGGTTDAASTHLSGSINAALDGSEHVGIYLDGTHIGDATVTGTTWTYNSGTLVVDGAHSYTAQVEDAAGHAGTASTAFALTFDATTPSTLGGTGNDTLIGDGNNNHLIGGAGADSITGGAGGAASDYASYETSTAAVTVNLLNPLDTTNPNSGDALGDTYTNITNVIGSNFDDVIIGNNTHGNLNGGDGNDNLFGGTDADTLNGGNGNDYLFGGAGANALSGGAGSNVFGFSMHNNTTVAGTQFQDNISDFQATPGPTPGVLTDRINLVDVADANGDTVINIQDLLVGGAPQEVTSYTETAGTGHFVFGKRFDAGRRRPERLRRRQRRGQPHQPADCWHPGNQRSANAYLERSQRPGQLCVTLAESSPDRPVATPGPPNKNAAVANNGGVFMTTCQRTT